MKGQPRHPIRLYSADDLDITVLVAEQFVPPVLGELLAGVDPRLDGVGGGLERSRCSLGFQSRTVRTRTAPSTSRRTTTASDASMTSKSRRWSRDSSTGRTRRCSNRGSTPAWRRRIHHAGSRTGTGRRRRGAARGYDRRDVRSGVDSEPLASFAADVRRHYEDLAERIEEREPDGTYDRMYM